jgi:outer membrane protein TolC
MNSPRMVLLICLLGCCGCQSLPGDYFAQVPRDLSLAAPPAVLAEEPASGHEVSAEDSVSPPSPPAEVLPAPQPSGKSAAKASGSRPVLGLEPNPSGEVLPPLSLAEVTSSVLNSFPALEAAVREAQIADGRTTAAWGEFDFKLKAESVSAPLGYYKNYRNAIKLEQALLPGGNIYGQYRIGEGDFPTWYGERETNEGGELKIGFISPLLRDRAIDQRRADIAQATLRRQQVDPAIQAQVLEFVFAAADAYWSWVAAGLSYDVQQNLLRVTKERNRVYEARVKEQDLAPIELVQNERLIATRESKVTEAERKLQQAAIKLSLFLRDEYGDPIVPSPQLLPASFPEPVRPDVEQSAAHIQAGLQVRPELRELAALRQQALVDLRQGENLLLPSLNATVDASKDVGARSSSKGDKTPFELEAGLYFDLPTQRRKGTGKIREVQGKLAQLAAKQRFTENKITTQIQDALSAMLTAYERVQQARQGVALADKLVIAENKRFDEQDSDLFRVALQEAVAIEAAVGEVEALADYFKAQAAFRAASGIDPQQP